MSKATYTYEAEFNRVKDGVHALLMDKLKEYPIPLPEFIALERIVSGLVAQHYREGAYHGDIDAKSEAPTSKEPGVGDPLWPLYQEYAAKVPPKGTPQLTYSGWLRRLADRLRIEAKTPKRAAQPTQGESK